MRAVTIVRPALDGLFLLPPPSPAALRLSGSHGARTWSAADRNEAAVVERMIGNVVLTDERGDLLGSSRTED